MTKTGQIPFITSQKLKTDMTSLKIANELKEKGFNPNLTKIGDLLNNSSDKQGTNLLGKIDLGNDEYSFWKMFQ